MNAERTEPIAGDELTGRAPTGAARRSPAAQRARIYWRCQLIGWTAYTAFWLVPSLIREPTMVGRMLTVSGCGMLLEIAGSHAYRLVIRRRGWAELPPTQLLPRAIVGSLVVGLAIAIASSPLSALYGDTPRPLRAWFYWLIATSVFSVFLWSVVYFGVHYFERWRQAERDKLALAVAAGEAKLQFLISQLNPHFLFNCLNSVRALIVEDPARAHTAVTALSTLIRYSLQATRVTTVALEAELEMVTTYLVLEGIRFEDRLRTRIDMAPATRGVPVPPMLIQALVENGVKHGVERLPAGGTIAVATWLDADLLRVQVTNSGRIVARDDSTRVGLDNARERLRLLYGPRASLAMREDADAVVAELALPVTGAAA